MQFATALAGALVLGLAGTTGLFLVRARNARRELSLRLHDAALRLDRRCDTLKEQIHTLDQRQRLGHLFDLLAEAQGDQRLDPDRARRLRRFALDLWTESLAGRT